MVDFGTNTLPSRPSMTPRLFVLDRTVLGFSNQLEDSVVAFAIISYNLSGWVGDDDVPRAGPFNPREALPAIDCQTVWSIYAGYSISDNSYKSIVHTTTTEQIELPFKAMS